MGIEVEGSEIKMFGAILVLPFIYSYVACMWGTAR